MVFSLSLSSSAKLAFVALSYVYIVKTIDTLRHGIFTDPVISLMVVSLNIVAGVAQLIFFYKLKSVSSNSDIRAHIAGWVGVVGATINIFPKILALTVLLQFSFPLRFMHGGQILAVMSTWLGHLMLLSCCLLFSFVSVRGCKDKVWAFRFGALGYMVLALTFSVVALQFLLGVRLNWQAGESGTSLTSFIISASFSYFCIGYFFTRFLGGNENIGNAKMLE